MARRRTPPEVLAIFAEARRAEAGSPPRKHHLVPASYLRRWAESGQIRVTAVDDRRTHTTAAEKAMRETDYYSLRHEQIDEEEMPPLTMEVFLGKFEAMAAPIIERLIQDGNRTILNPEERFHFSWFLAFQLTRGRAFRSGLELALNDGYKLLYAGITDEQIAEHLADRGVDPTPETVAEHRHFHDELQAGIVTYSKPDPALVVEAAKAAEGCAEHLFARRWEVVETMPVLITSDEPAVLVSGPGSPRDERGGVANAGVALFPLDPSHLLAMFHEDMPRTGHSVLDTVDTTDVNREILAHTTRWAFERPSRRVTLALSAGPAPPLFAREPVSVRDGRELHRLYKPTRWTGQPAPPWPVPEWWYSAWQVKHPPMKAHPLKQPFPGP